MRSNATPDPDRAGEAPAPARLKRTPLYGAHRRRGAKMVEFAGWQMPVQYSGVIEEHQAVRERAGLFDVSHMGEIEVRGPGASATLQRVTANDVSRLAPFQAQYSLLLNPEGGIVDDVVLHKLGDEHYLICVNAVNTEKDCAWLGGHAAAAEVIDRSGEYGQLALQGPLAESVLQPLTSLSLKDIAYYRFALGEVAGVRCLVARTGYTGEDGFELYCPWGETERLWEELLGAGEKEGVRPCGLGARDTLRLERALPLYGNELDESTTPLEAGLGWVVKFDKGDFLGRERLWQQNCAGVKRRLVGLELLEPGIARSQAPVWKSGRRLGAVTSGTRSPTLKKSIALAYVESDEATAGNQVAVEVRGRMIAARLVALPFYRRDEKVQRRR
jgi:aminomethyltransferase